MVNLRDAGPVDYARFVFSALLLIFSTIITSYAIVEQKTNFWNAVPGWATLILFVLVLFWLGVVEGLQIALVELKRQHAVTYKQIYPRAYQIGQVAGQGDNTERFLMGRQVFVVFLVFFAAKLTTIHSKNKEDFLFPVPGWFSSVFLETGILACLVVVIVAQLMPQIVAAKYPVHFLQIWIMKPAYYACIFLEITGITHICWVLSHCMGYVFGMHDDETIPNPIEIVVDAADVLDKLETSLESGEISASDSQPSMNSDKQLIPEHHHHHHTQFSELVNEVNKQLNPDTLCVLRHYLDSHPEKFAKFPYMIGNKMYPAPQAIAEQFTKEGYDVPKFLTAISDPNHIPPHIVACELLSQLNSLQEEINLLRAKLDIA